MPLNSFAAGAVDSLTTPLPIVGVNALYLGGVALGIAAVVGVSRWALGKAFGSR